MIQEIPHTPAAVWRWRWLAIWGPRHRHTAVAERREAAAWSSACRHTQDDSAPQGAVTDPRRRLRSPQTTATVRIWWWQWQSQRLRRKWRPGRGQQRVTSWHCSTYLRLQSFAFCIWSYFCYCCFIIILVSVVFTLSHIDVQILFARLSCMLCVCFSMFVSYCTFDSPCCDILFPLALQNIHFDSYFLQKKNRFETSFFVGHCIKPGCLQLLAVEISLVLLEIWANVKWHAQSVN